MRAGAAAGETGELGEVAPGSIEGGGEKCVRTLLHSCVSCWKKDGENLPSPFHPLSPAG